MQQGLFISIEGTDGSGKSTQIRLLENYYQSKQKAVLLLRDPGGTLIGEKIRQILLDTKHAEMVRETEMMLYAASRAQLMHEKIKPALAQGQVVICDRFVDSSLVYQGVARGLGLDSVWEVNLAAVANTMPQLTFFLKVEPEIALKRRLKESGADRLEMEGLSFQKKVFDAYLLLAARFQDRICIIDATKSEALVFQQIQQRLEQISEEIL